MSSDKQRSIRIYSEEIQFVGPGSGIRLKRVMDNLRQNSHVGQPVGRLSGSRVLFYTSLSDREIRFILASLQAHRRIWEPVPSQRHAHLTLDTSRPILISASMSKDKQESSHDIGADKTTPTAAMPTFDKVAGNEEKPRSELTGGWSTQAYFSEVLYPSVGNSPLDLTDDRERTGKLLL